MSNEKADHVRRAGQDRNHECHWPGCSTQVPPAMWGCKSHWFKLPKQLRDRVWAAYVPGQEKRGDPSEEYLVVAHEVQQWIEEHYPGGGELVTMKAVSLWQPWASLIALRVKTIETRSWATSYRGPLAIHAAQKAPVERVVIGGWEAWPADKKGHRHPNHDGPRPARLYWNEGGLLSGGTWHVLPLGAVVATCTLVDVIPTDGIEAQSAGWVRDPAWDLEANRPYGDFSPGRFIWLLADIHHVDPPLAATGRQQLWDWARVETRAANDS